MPASSRSTLAALVPPALLAALLPGGCAPSSTPAERLVLEFPAEAALALGGPRSRFADSERGFSADVDTATIAIDLPRDAAGPIAIHSGALAIEVRELDAEGSASRAAHAIAYPRAGLTSYWSAGAGEVEEWIHVAAGVARRGVPLLAWEVAGASLRQRGAEVNVTSARSVEMLRVTAPVAYASGGRKVEASLRVSGQTIQLFVDADGDALLVDPKWTAAMPMAGPRYYHAAARLQSGKVLVCGGSLGLTGGELDTAEIYDPTVDQWSDAGNMAATRANHTATTLTDGTVLVVAGSVSMGASVIAGTELYDPALGWSTKPSIPNARSNHTATRLDSGNVLVAGGFGGSGTPVSMTDAEIYDPNMAGGGWSFTDPMFGARARHTAVELQDHRVLVAGGNTFGAPSATAEIYDETSGHWTKTMNAMNVARENHGAALLADGTVLVVGGDDAAIPTPNPLASAEIYDPVADTWTTTGPLNDARTSHTTTLLNDGTVLVAGGEDAVSSLATAEIYDPMTKMWSPAPDMITARSDHTATLLNDGRVLVAGGDNASGDIALAEIYSTGTTCTMDPECPPNQWCNVDTCAPKKADGAAATKGDECTSGFSHDGVCCDKACDGGPCEACSMAAGATKDGECTEVAAKCDDKNPCTDDACMSGTCVSLSRLDGTTCPGGVCIAGACLLDMSPTTSSSGGSAANGSGGPSASASGSGGAGGSGGGVETATGELVGGGCSAAPATPLRTSFFAGGLFALLFARRRRRRARS